MSASEARLPFVGGNWKCSADKDTVESILQWIPEAKELTRHVDVMVAPSHIHIGKVLDTIPKQIKVAAQNINSIKGYGAFTGEHSAAMLKDFGLEWVILGHSERRHIYKESSDEIAKKVRAAIDEKLNVVLCIGETLEERDADQTYDVLIKQLSPVNKVLSNEDWKHVVIAYEPVWAIGTGKTASADQAEEIHNRIRAWIADEVDESTSSATRIIYGGSVKGANASSLISKANIDGFLVGGASLKPEFIDIIKAAM